MASKSKINYFPALLVCVFLFNKIDDVICERLSASTCKQAQRGLGNCQLSCAEGFAYKYGCPVCKCRNSLCTKELCGPNSKCQVRETAFLSSHFAVCDIVVPKVSAIVQESEKTTTRNPINFRQLSGEVCEQQGRCDGDSVCPAGYACRDDGRCCKTTPSDPVELNLPRCLREPDIQRCSSLTVQFYYNVKTGKCSVLTGCGDLNGNTFNSKAQCQNECENPCAKPLLHRQCRRSRSRYYYSPEVKRCIFWDDRNCDENGVSFISRQECDQHCLGRANPESSPDYKIKSNLNAKTEIGKPTENTLAASRRPYRPPNNRLDIYRSRFKSMMNKQEKEDTSKFPQGRWVKVGLNDKGIPDRVGFFGLQTEPQTTTEASKSGYSLLCQLWGIFC